MQKLESERRSDREMDMKRSEVSLREMQKLQI